ncbi:MAG: AMP-binding protein, partial [Acidimicrobiia bacterium]|nr:AMP-binding protein [Acidimicrobiia bacterium]
MTGRPFAVAARPADLLRTRRMPDLLAMYAAAHPDKPAVIDDRPGEEQVTLSYAELDERANRLAAVMRSHGLGQGAT